MHIPRFHPGPGEHTVVISRVAPRHWHALEDDLVVGRGEVSLRPDGRRFLSIDAWRGVVFDQLADAMLSVLPRPLYTVVDEADLDLCCRWARAGFATRRREWEYLLPTGPRVTAPPPSGVSMVPLGQARDEPLRELDRAIREEVETTVGWAEMPAEPLVRPPGGTVLDPSAYAVAVRSGRYVGLVRVSRSARRSRIGLIAVRAEQRRRGIGRALLDHVTETLWRSGIETTAVDVKESNPAAMALVESAGARARSANLELVLRPAGGDAR